MIRILTLLVSLFSFGLVDLAEITYEIPVTDMLYFNDTPIEELNGLTLNEFFIDSNITESVTDNEWLAENGAFFDTNGYILVNTRFSSITASLSIQPTSSQYLMIYTILETTSGLDLKHVLSNGLNFVITSLSSNLGYYQRRINTSFTVNQQIFYQDNTAGQIKITDIYLYNLTTLGLTSLTNEQLDRYYQLWLNPQLNITYEINTLDTQDLIILLASQSVWTIMIHLLYKYAYRPKKKSKRLGM
jgi:hypothetical protein